MNFVDYVYDKMPAAGMSYFPQWGMDQRDEIQIKRVHSGEKLGAIFVNNDSQIDQCWIGGASWPDAGQVLLGYKNPVFGIPDGTSDVWARPYQFFGSNTDALATKYYDAPQGSAGNPYAITQAFVQAYRGQIYGRSGGYISLRAYYGSDYPRDFPNRRSVFQRDHGLSVARGNLPPVDAAGVPVYATVFRNIIVGRDYWKLVGMQSSGAFDAFLLWRIYGCIGLKGVTETRVLLASGTGVSTIQYQGTTGYDAIEMDAARNDGAGGTGVCQLRFEARDA